MSCLPCGCDPEAHWRCAVYPACRPLNGSYFMTQPPAQTQTTQPPRNEAFHSLLKQLGDLHDRKNHDYSDTANGNYYSNFELAAKTAGCSVDTVFRVMLGIKLARLDELLKGKTPLHESLNDSLIDLTCYAALWTSYRQKETT